MVQLLNFRYCDSTSLLKPVTTFYPLCTSLVQWCEKLNNPHAAPQSPGIEQWRWGMHLATGGAGAAAIFMLSLTVGRLIGCKSKTDAISAQWTLEDACRPWVRPYTSIRHTASVSSTHQCNATTTHTHALKGSTPLTGQPTDLHLEEHITHEAKTLYSTDSGLVGRDPKLGCRSVLIG